MCAGSAQVQARWVPSVETGKHPHPHPHQEAISNWLSAKEKLLFSNGTSLDIYTTLKSVTHSQQQMPAQTSTMMFFRLLFLSALMRILFFVLKVFCFSIIFGFVFSCLCVCFLYLFACLFFNGEEIESFCNWVDREVRSIWEKLGKEKTVIRKYCMQ